MLWNCEGCFEFKMLWSSNIYKPQSVSSNICHKWVCSILLASWHESYLLGAEDIFESAYSHVRNIADELHTPINTLITITYIANISHTELNKIRIYCRLHRNKSSLLSIHIPNEITYLTRHLIYWIKITLPDAWKPLGIEWNTPSKEYSNIKLNHIEQLHDLLN